jgi:hypothetical protein
LNDSCQCFFFQFCGVAKWQSPIVRFSQIQVQAKYENNSFLNTLLYFLASYLNTMCRLIGGFFLNFAQTPAIEDQSKKTFDFTT